MLGALRREPDRIRDEISRLESDIDEACLDHYNAFIVNHKAFRFVETQVSRDDDVVFLNENYLCSSRSLYRCSCTFKFQDVK